MLGAFACVRYRFLVETTTPLRLHSFAAATLRGGFGHVFKRTVCTWPPADCPRCLLKSTCAYPYIFETAPPDSEKLRGLDQLPRPYVIERPDGAGGESPQSYGRGERFDFRVVLVGRAIELLHCACLQYTHGAEGRERGSCQPCPGYTREIMAWPQGED